MASTPVKRTDPFRLSLYGKIEVAKKQLGLDEDAYRDLLAARYAGKRSRRQLGNAQLVDLVEHFKSLGFKASPPTRKAGTRAQADSPEHRKMRALWLTLYHLGVIEDASEAALAGFARRVTGGKETGVATLHWVRGQDAFKTIEALKARAARPVEQGGGGVDWSSYQILADGVMQSREYPRARVIEAQWRRLCELKVMHNPNGLDVWLELMTGEKRRIFVLNVRPEDADRIIDSFGRKIRKALAARKAAGS
jgi:phage gp16-like protein